MESSLRSFIQLLVLVLLATLPAGALADEYDTLREAWKEKLLAESPSASSVVSTATKYWTGSNPINSSPSAASFYLWSDLPLGSVSANLVSTAKRLEDMALAYALPTSSLYGNAGLAATLSAALDWLYANAYKTSGGQYDNWYHWEVTTPKALNNTVVLLYSALSSVQVGTHCAAVDNFGPGSDNAAPFFNWPSLTSANTADVVLVTAVRGILGKSADKLTEAQTNLGKVFNYTTNGDGFYADGSYIFHRNVAYTGQYGTVLLENIGDIVNLLDGSTWAITDPDLANIYTWIDKGFKPLLYNGALMDMVRGRAIAWSSTTAYDEGAQALDAIRTIANFAPEPTASELLAFVDAPRLAAGQFHFASMDRVVALRSGFGFGVSMSSTRISNYENLHGTSNLKGWCTGDGMTYLYAGDVDNQFTDDFWPTVDYHHLPGTTAEQGFKAQPNTTDQSWVGGASVASTYGAAGMSLHPAASSGANSTLYGKKSWFMLDSKIVCLGSGITCTTTNQVDTTVENRRLGTAPTANFHVNGTVYPPSVGWSTVLNGPTWCALDGVGGYYFPGGATNLQASIVSSSGAWTDIRPTDSDATIYTNNYLQLYFKHGAAPTNAQYAYVILPGMAATDVGAYAANPSVTIITNTANVHAVKDTGLGVVGANFWSGRGGTADWITVDKAASVMTMETYNTVAVGVSDPTQTNNGTITLTIDRAATGLIAKDPDVTVTQLTPKIIFSVNVNGAKGKTFNASFNQLPQPPVITSLLAAGGNLSEPFAYKITASNTPDSYAASGLPPGLGVDPDTGEITGTPTATGTYGATISATNPGGTTSAALSITILTARPTISGHLSVAAVNGQFLSYQIEAGNSPTSYAATGLPAGLSIDTSTGLISGTPVGATFPATATITATNAGGATTATMTITDVVTTFATPGTSEWVCPANVTSVQVECWGGGGAGGSAARNGAGGAATGGGGAGGAYAKRNSIAVTPGAVYYIRVGEGGVNAATVNATQVSGGDSWFNETDAPSSTIIAKGGGGGGSAIGVGIKGSGGTPTPGSVGDVVHSGGFGIASTVTAFGGGGGGSGGTSSPGNAPASSSDGLGAVAAFGGGNGGNANPVSGSSGAGQSPTIPPGGGGGGARDASSTLPAVRSGGNGAAGRVVVTAIMGSTPLVTPTGATGITATNATLGGHVVSDGGSAITARGVVYAATAVNANPQIGGPGVTLLASSGTTGPFTANADTLTPGTAYTFCAYAANIQGTTYSALDAFTTLTSVEDWRQAAFGTTANTGDAADSADADGDGLSNAEEYILGTAPKTADNSSLPVLLEVVRDSASVNFSFVARAATGTGYHGLTRHYAVMTTTNLHSTWSVLPGYADIVGSGQSVTGKLPLGDGPGFFRLDAWLE